MVVPTATTKGTGRRPRPRMAVPQEPAGRLGLGAGTRQASKPGEQCSEMRPVLLRHGGEFQSQSVARLTMPHDGLGADLAFLDEKIDFGFRPYRLWNRGSNKQTCGAQVPDAGDIILTITAPTDPDPVGRLDAGGMPPRIRRCLRRGGHKAPLSLAWLQE